MSRACETLVYLVNLVKNWRLKFGTLPETLTHFQVKMKIRFSVSPIADHRAINLTKIRFPISPVYNVFSARWLTFSIALEIDALTSRHVVASWNRFITIVSLYIFLFYPFIRLSSVHCNVIIIFFNRYKIIRKKFWIESWQCLKIGIAAINY